MNDVLTNTTDIDIEDIETETEKITAAEKTEGFTDEANPLNRESPENLKDSETPAELPENVFLTSLNNLREEDIALNEAAQNAKKPPVDFVRYFILLACLSVFAYTSYYIVDQLFQYAAAANDNTAFRELFHGIDEDIMELGVLPRARANRPIPDMLSLQRQAVREVEAITHEGVTEAEQRKLRFERLRASGISSIYGWLRVSGTNIDYPVVQGPDNDFYLRRNPHGFSMTAGSLFVDYRNERNVDNNWNTIIYGHNMGNRTKFSDLLRFDTNEQLFNSALIELTTPDAVYIYEVFSAHVAHERFFFREVWWPSEEDRIEWFYIMKGLSRFQNERVSFTEDSRIITLQTCTNTIWNPRFVVHGILIDVIR